MFAGSDETFPLGARVLCVDDESMIGEVVERILRTRLRCQVEFVSSAEEALKRIGREWFDAIVIDYVMPEMDGRELYRRLERDYPDATRRLLFITGDTLTESTLDFIAETGRPLLEKPFGLPELTEAVAHLLRQRFSVLAEMPEHPAGGAA
jgi:CheY-like chemotaxis protein